MEVEKGKLKRNEQEKGGDGGVLSEQNRDQAEEREDLFKTCSGSQCHSAERPCKV